MVTEVPLIEGKFHTSSANPGRLLWVKPEQAKTSY